MRHLSIGPLRPLDCNRFSLHAGAVRSAAAPGRRDCDEGGGSRDASCGCRIVATKLRDCATKVYCLYDTPRPRRTGMSELAIPAELPDGEAPTPAATRRV